MLPVRAFTILLVITWIGCGANAQSPRIFIESRTGDAISVSSSTNHTWQFGPNSGGGLGFGFYDETPGSTRLQLTLNGYVGIGTTTPGFRLDVNGPIRSSMGGFVFPDGTIQLSAGAGQAYSAGTGLTLSNNVFFITPGGVTAALLAADSVTSGTIAPASVQTSDLADGAVTAVKLAADTLSGVQQVIHGVVTFTGSNTDVSQTFSPSIDPTKSYVIVGTPVFDAPVNDGITHQYTRLGATLIELTSTRITLAVDTPNSSSFKVFPCRVSFQIIQFK